jgi:hypothetical protein
VAPEARPTCQRGRLGTGETTSESGRAAMRRWWCAGQRLAAAAMRVPVLQGREKRKKWEREGEGRVLGFPSVQGRRVRLRWHDESARESHAVAQPFPGRPSWRGQVGHQSSSDRLTARLCPLRSPKPLILGKNSFNEICRATRGL